MVGLRIITQGDGAWPDLAGKTVVKSDDIEMAALARGMTSGRPSVTIRVNLPDGTVVIAQTSLQLLMTAVDAFRAAHGDPRQG